MTYLFPVKIALILFPFLSILLTIPFAIYSYRKFGSITFMRVFVLFTLIFYLMAAFFMTILPLPDMADVANSNAPAPQLIPFHFIADFINQTVLVITDPSTYLPALTQDVFIQPLFNIFLLLPLGVYLRYYFRLSIGKTTLIAFLLSFFFEITQLTGLFFLYPHAYRLFDVDDLILNTVGGLIGYALAPLFTFFLPSREKMDQTSSARSTRVSFVRRFLATFIDWFLLNVMTGLLTWLHLLPFSEISSSGSDYYKKIIWQILLIFLYFIVLPSLTNGLTIGKWIVHIRIVRIGESRVKLKHLLVRYGLLYYLVGGLIIIPLNEQIPKITTPQLTLVLFAISAATALLFAIHISANFFARDKRLFYEKMSRTTEVSTYRPKPT
ncbi:VanZ family protein [Listeria sp. ILCC797]|uniref:VanZ family protein n=1 Tax=Listeria sp. ILCC797 TaxID=1918333 RepID=UPI000B590D7C|nr:VanZ family protein [Listeria sp. ILCC797]